MLGFSLDNVDQPPTESYDKLVAAKAQIIGMLWTDGTRHRRGVYEAIESRLSKPHYTLRVGPSQQIPVDVWIQDFKDAIAEVPQQILDENRLSIRHFNEGNLPEEGGWQPVPYAQHYIACRSYVKFDRPNMRIGPMPLSLGLAGWEAWYTEFTNSVNIHTLDFISVNCYAHLVPQVDFFLKYGQPVRVTEYNTLDLNNRPQWLLDTYNSFRAKGVESAEIFISGGKSYGGWNEAYIVSLDECRVIGQRPQEQPVPPTNQIYPKALFTPLQHNFSVGGAMPKIIVVHGTSGLGDPYGHWNNPATKASADFWIPRAGPKVKQYVKLGDTSWSNGPLNKPDMTVPFLAWLSKYQNTHPEITGNHWTTSIEFEKAPGNKQGLTNWQVTEGRELIKWLSDENAIPLDRNHVLGHYQFDSVNRPFCPGPVPWEELISNYPELAERNFWGPMWSAINWARMKGRVTAEEQRWVHELINRDKELAGVQ